MSKTWLLLDVNNLAWRNYHVMKGLSHNGTGTGVTFGVLRDIQLLQKMHGTNRIAFCFDFGASRRTDVYPGYKAARRKKAGEPEEDQKREEVRSQLNKLRKEYLWDIGFRNVFYQQGYEADDLIASIVRNSLQNDHAIIVSTDKDLYQLLGERVIVWNSQKKRTYTRHSLLEEYGVTPEQWATLKAIAGCSTDGIVGVPGVGEKTAARYINRELKPDSKAFRAIREAKELRKANLELVHLPFQGTKVCELVDDEVTSGGWRRVASGLGMKSLIRDVPVMGARVPKAREA